MAIYFAVWQHAFKGAVVVGTTHSLREACLLGLQHEDYSRSQLPKDTKTSVTIYKTGVPPLAYKHQGTLFMEVAAMSFFPPTGKSPRP